MKKITLILIAFVLTIPSISFAHSGRTDASGCHTCRTNCASWGLSTGEYHCHRSKGVTQPTEPIRSIRNEGGIGKTVPAPEYKIPVKTNTIKTQTVTTPTGTTNNKINKPVSNTTPSHYVEKPSAIKRFFNWLF